MTARKTTPAATRARRLLSLLHLLERDAAYSISDIAAMLGTTEGEIAADLDALSCCGVAPYYPDQLIPLFVEDGVVRVFGEPPALEKGVRLSLTEARALAAALQTAGRPADDPLTVRLLAAAAPDDVSSTQLERVVRSAVTPDTRGVLATMAAALEARHAVSIVYRSAGSDTDTERTVEPISLIAERSAWYVDAFCRKAGAVRTFRVDRIRRATLLDEVYPMRSHAAPGASFEPGELPTAIVRFADARDYAERDWPGARIVARDNDSCDVEIPYAGTAWIARQVVARLGTARVISPDDVMAAVTELATEILSQM